MEPIAEKLRPLAERYGLGDIYVFGSRAQEIAGRGSAPPGADLDVAVQPGVGCTLATRDRVR